MSNGAPTLEHALQLQQAGDFSAAESAYHEILNADPHNSAARCGWGLLCEAQGRLAEAVEHLEQNIRLDPRHLESHLQRAKIFHLKNQTEIAAAGYRDVLQIQPRHAVARVSLANIAYRDGRFPEAERHLREAIGQHPQFAFAQHSLGRVLKAQAKFQEAVVVFQRAIELDAAFVENYSELAAVYAQLGQSAQAESAYRRALQLAPQNTANLNGLGMLLLSTGRQQEAATCFRRVVAIDPALAVAHNNLGLALNALGDHEAALISFQQALTGLPDSPDVLANLATAYLALARLAEAEQTCRDALNIAPQHVAALSQRGLIGMRRGNEEQALRDFQFAVRQDPTLAEAHNNLGTAFYALNRHHEAVESFSRALELNPWHAEAHYNRGLARLRLGDFERGWPDYEWRRKRKRAAMSRWNLPEWEGSSLGGKSLLIFGEQGIGDELMFATCYGEIIKRAKHSLLICEQRLVGLFARSFPAATVLSAGDNREISQIMKSLEIDYCVAAGSLPRYLQQRLGESVLSPAYLRADIDRIHHWKQRYANLSTYLRVGVSWRGGADAETINRRSVDLAQWQPLWDLPNVAYINLQYGDCREELAQLKQLTGREIHDFDDADPLKDLDDFAAQIAAVDLVISIDNSTVHMAGGLGVPTWAAIPTSADWRWGTQGATTQWYESVRLFRRSPAEAWSAVFERMARSLG